LPVILSIRKNLVLLLKGLYTGFFRPSPFRTTPKVFLLTQVSTDFSFPLAANLQMNYLLFSGKYVPIFSFYEKCTT